MVTVAVAVAVTVAVAVDLSAPEWAEETREDLQGYVQTRLGAVTSVGMDAAAIAEHLLSLSRAAGEGAIFLARVVTTQLLATPVDTSRPGWEAELAARNGNRAAYRLSHQRLAQHLRPERRLLETLENDPESAGSLKSMNPSLPSNVWIGSSAVLAKNSSSSSRPSGKHCSLPAPAQSLP